MNAQFAAQHQTHTLLPALGWQKTGTGAKAELDQAIVCSMTDQAPKPELEQIRDKLGRLATSLETGENFPEGHQLVLMLRHWENTIEVENTKRITMKAELFQLSKDCEEYAREIEFVGAKTWMSVAHRIRFAAIHFLG